MILLMLDFDGTLVPIRPRPELAKLSRSAQRLLDDLCLSPDIKVAIISGRRLSELKKLIGIKNIYYAGCHGLEISGPGIKFTHPQARAALPYLKGLLKELNRLKTTTPGLLIEDKGLSVAIHYRNVDAKNNAFVKRQIFSLSEKYPRLLCQSGRKVCDFRPDVSWGKGEAVKVLLEKFKAQNPLPIYIGDDETDEDAFKALRGIGLTILVENPEKKPGRSFAVFKLKSTNEVSAFLKSLV